jgi:hypothetical protein
MFDTSMTSNLSPVDHKGYSILPKTKIISKNSSSNTLCPSLPSLKILQSNNVSKDEDPQSNQSPEGNIRFNSPKEEMENKPE